MRLKLIKVCTVFLRSYYWNAIRPFPIAKSLKLFDLTRFFSQKVLTLLLHFNCHIRIIWFNRFGQYILWDSKWVLQKFVFIVLLKICYDKKTYFYRGPIIYVTFFFDGRTPSRYETRAGALMEHFLKTLVHFKKPYSKWPANTNQPFWVNLPKNLNGTLPF